MSTNDTFLAIFLGSRTGPRRKTWDAMTDEERRAKEQEGLAAWKAWMERHHDAIVYAGGPVGKTKRASRTGVTDVANDLAVFIVVRAASHEDAARMFEDHPHFAIFPGEAIEVMPLLPVPGAQDGN